MEENYLLGFKQTIIQATIQCCNNVGDTHNIKSDDETSKEVKDQCG